MLTYDMSTYEPAKASNFVENGTVPHVDFKCLSLISRSRELFTVVSYSRLPYPLAVVTLSQSLTMSVHFYPLADTEPESDFVSPLLPTG